MGTTAMDALSDELHHFLRRLGERPEQVGDKLQGYVRALLRLLTPADEQLVMRHYGLFGCTAESAEQLASQYNTDAETVRQVLAQCLRKIAVTPEWQSVKPLTQLRAIKLK